MFRVLTFIENYFSMTKKDLFELISRFLDGNATEEEIKLINQYYQSFQEDYEWPDALFSEKELIKEKVGARLRQAVFLNEHTNPHRKKKKYWWAAAAVLLIVVIVGMRVFVPQNSNSAIEKGIANVLETKRGERKMVLLSDSTRVWVGPDSQIEYPVVFDAKERSVKFRGDAFFEVRHETDRPFVIQSDVMQTKVLGTVFNLHTDGNICEVVLVSGRVDVAVGTQRVVLQPNRKAVFSRLQSRLVEEPAPYAQDYTARKEGKYIYKGVELKYVIEDLERCFACQINVQGKISDCSFFGSFEETDPIEKILKIISLTLNGKSSKEADGSFLISGTGCSQT